MPDTTVPLGPWDQAVTSAENAVRHLTAASRADETVPSHEHGERSYTALLDALAALGTARATDPIEFVNHVADDLAVSIMGRSSTH
ncbi:hypothetical protein IL38_24000 [Actinopolyspora erythraea]|uniref:Uncharacterized protein n=1 Tax=Actinopolyspora erythraea TaxID=414996 RepID=A0ABR4WY99_9ACTN|nr:hypothetical protein [Actinopolyspora erythraea]KGI79364.1 hypothetical protein IL38_24000 [Actinopolyspora erythraea]